MNASTHAPTYSQEDVANTAPWHVGHPHNYRATVVDAFGRPVITVNCVELGNAQHTLALRIAEIPRYDELVGLVVAGETKAALALAFEIAARVYA